MPASSHAIPIINTPLRISSMKASVMLYTLNSSLYGRNESCINMRVIVNNTPIENNRYLARLRIVRTESSEEESMPQKTIDNLWYHSFHPCSNLGSS